MALSAWLIKFKFSNLAFGPFLLGGLHGLSLSPLPAASAHLLSAHHPCHTHSHLHSHTRAAPTSTPARATKVRPQSLVPLHPRQGHWIGPGPHRPWEFVARPCPQSVSTLPPSGRPVVLPSALPFAQIPKWTWNRRRTSSTITAQTDCFLPRTPRPTLVGNPSQALFSVHSTALSFPQSMVPQEQSPSPNWALSQDGDRGGGEHIRGSPDLLGPGPMTAQPGARTSVAPDDFHPGTPQGRNLLLAPISPLIGAGEYVWVPVTDSSSPRQALLSCLGVRELFLHPSLLLSVRTSTSWALLWEATENKPSCPSTRPRARSASVQDGEQGGSARAEGTHALFCSN